MSDSPKPTLMERLLTSRKPEAPQTRYDSGLALRGIQENLTITRTGEITAWYLASPQRWSFRTTEDRNAIIAAYSTRLSELTGRRVITRITHRPYPTSHWARQLDKAAIDPLDGWSDYLEQEQRKVMRLPLDDKLVYYGIQLGRLSNLGRGALIGASQDKKIRLVLNQLREVSRTMASPGLSAGPASAADMDWLLARSIGLLLPAPLARHAQPDGTWDPGDLSEWTDGIEWSAEPFARCVRIAGLRNGEQVERYVTVLTLGRMNLGPIPETQGPWMQRLDRLPFPYEAVSIFDIREPELVAKEIQHQLDRVHHQVLHHHEHGEEGPLSLQRQHAEAREIEDELRTGFTGSSARAQGWIRIAVAGRSADQVDERADLVRKLFSPSVLVHRPIAQYGLSREFIPGEPLSNNAHMRRMPVSTLAGALPAATSEVGDRIGPNIGFTSGISRRAVMWHPWDDQETREKSGLTPVVGTLGSGKSVLGGTVVYHTLRMGAPWYVLDPSGPLTRLCGMAELKRYSTAINLYDAEPGTLNPFRITPDPRKEHFHPENFLDSPDPTAAAEREYNRALSRVTGERMTLVRDVLKGLLPVEVARKESTQVALLVAVRTVINSALDDPGKMRSLSAHDVIAQLRQDAREGADDVAEFLSYTAETPQGQLIFPSSEGGDDLDRLRQSRLTVMSLRGVALPPDDARPEEWTDEERYGVSVLNLSAWYTQRAIYDRPLYERKGLLLDECHALMAVPSGRQLIKKTGRDSRKHRVRALYATQDAGDILTAQVDNWTGAVFVGQTVGEDAQRGALRLLGIEAGHGYEQVLGSLSPVDRRAPELPRSREFIFSDGNGGIERITVALDRPELLDALTPTRSPHPAKDANPFTSTDMKWRLSQGDAR